MGGKSVCPNSSTGTLPLYAERSSSTYCACRERFATTRMDSPSKCRMKVSTFRFSGYRNSSEPRPNALCRLRSAMSRFMNQSRDAELPWCASTFRASK